METNKSIVLGTSHTMIGFKNSIVQPRAAPPEAVALCGAVQIFGAGLGLPVAGLRGCLAL